MPSQPATPARPDTISSHRLPTPAKRDPAELNERLGRLKNVEYVLKNHSGMGANTTVEFHDTYAIYKGLQALGLDVTTELRILEEKARISGDEGGKNKLQEVQLLEEKPVLFPGAGTMYPAAEPDPGLIASGFNWLFGNKKGAS